MELLVVIIVIGILAAIALPSFLNVAARARQSQAKIYVGSITNAQNQYRLENPTYAASADELGIFLPAEDDNYTYSITATATRGDIAASATDSIALQSFRGTAAIVNGLATSRTCQTVEPSGTAPATNVTATGLECGANAEQMR